MLECAPAKSGLLKLKVLTKWRTFLSPWHLRSLLLKAIDEALLLFVHAFTVPCGDSPASRHRYSMIVINCEKTSILSFRPALKLVLAEIPGAASVGNVLLDLFFFLPLFLFQFCLPLLKSYLMIFIQILVAPLLRF